MRRRLVLVHVAVVVLGAAGVAPLARAEETAASRGAPVASRPERVVAGAPDRALCVVGWFTTATLAVSAGVAGYLGATKAHQLESLRAGAESGITHQELDEERSKARTLLMFSDIAAGAAVLAGGFSLYLTLSGGREGDATSLPRSPTLLRPEVRLGIAPNGLRFTGTF